MTTDPNGITPPVQPVLPDPPLYAFPTGAEYNGTLIQGAFGCWWVVIKNIAVRQQDIGSSNEIQVDIQIMRMNCTSVTTYPNDQSKWTLYSEGLLPYGVDQSKLIEDNVLPAIGATFDTFLGGLPRTGKMWETEARLRDYTIATAGVGTLTASLTFATLYQLPPVACPYTATDITLDLPISVDATSGFRSSLLYRRFDWTVVAEVPPATADWTGVDLGGSPVNPTGIAAGSVFSGIPVEVPQTRIRIRTVQDTTVTTAGIVDTMDEFQAMLGCRNSETFLGFTQGKLWCDGVAFQPLDHNFYEVTFDFVYDHWYEHSQFPKFSPDGEIDLNEDGNPDTVIWVRPQRQEVDFNEIWVDNPQQAELLQEGWWKLYNAGDPGILGTACGGGGGGDVDPPPGEA